MPKEYNIQKTSGVCCTCEAQLEPGTEFIAAIRETDEGFERLDHCTECWKKSQGGSNGYAAVWQSRVPLPREKKKLLVDDEVLITFFRRLEEAEQESKIAFRFVLALVLMRKKILSYEGSAERDGCDAWRMRFRGSDETCEVIDPHMDEERIAEVTAQIGEIIPSFEEESSADEESESPS